MAVSQPSGQAEAQAQAHRNPAPADAANEAPTLQRLHGRAEDTSPPAGHGWDEAAVADVMHQMAKLERRVRVQFCVLTIVVIGGLALFFKNLLVEDVIIRQTLMESKELKLLDNDGNARLFLRMYSKVPVLQIMDSNGKPRMSLGLRFDDTPFLDLSDRSGRTRATFEMTEDDAPAIRLFDENGNRTFNIN